MPEPTTPGPRFAHLDRKAIVDARAMASSFQAPLIGQKVHHLNRVVEAVGRASPEALRGALEPSAGLVAAMDKHAELLRKAELRPLRQVDPRSL